jgi:hypothetical protein
VVNNELRASSKEISEGHFPFIRLEAVILGDSNPRQFLSPPRDLVTAPRQFFFRLKQLEPGGEPCFA